MAQRLGNVSVGQVVKLKENGSPVDYLVVHQGLPSSMYDASCNGTWLLRKDIHSNRKWTTTSENNRFTTSVASDYLPSLLSQFDENVQNKIKEVKIPYYNGVNSDADKIYSGASGFVCKLFLLSMRELGFLAGDPSLSADDGVKLSYFNSGTSSSANNKRIANFNGSPCLYWTRSPRLNSTKAVWEVRYEGYAIDVYGYNSPDGIRPAMVLPTDLLVDDSGLITGDTYPIPPAAITVPTGSVPAGGTIAVSWSTVSGATYQLQRSIDGGGWEDLYSGGNTSYNDTAGVWDKVQYRVASVKSGVPSGYTTSKEVLILSYTVERITAPGQVMEGQEIPVSWSAAEAASTYVLERKSSAADWAQIYSGAGTAFTDTPEDGWTMVQYRVKAGKDGTFGNYTTSPEIPVISASALVISGQDGDLGTLTADVPYTVSSDTGNSITLTRTVNNVLVASLTVESGFVYDIPVIDLPTGSGTIVIEASVKTSSGGTVTATRSWTYTKTPVEFSNIGGTAQLTKQGQNVFPETIAECVRVGANLGGDLGHALQLLTPFITSGAKIDVGSYLGTGTLGPDNPNTLTFSFEPKILFVFGGNEGSLAMINPSPKYSGYITSNYLSGNVSWGNNVVSWYAEMSATAQSQFNNSGTMYYYVAIG